MARPHSRGGIQAAREVANPKCHGEVALGHVPPRLLHKRSCPCTHTHAPHITPPRTANQLEPWVFPRTTCMEPWRGTCLASPSPDTPVRGTVSAPACLHSSLSASSSPAHTLTLSLRTPPNPHLPSRSSVHVPVHAHNPTTHSSLHAPKPSSPLPPWLRNTPLRHATCTCQPAITHTHAHTKPALTHARSPCNTHLGGPCLL